MNKSVLVSALLFASTVLPSCYSAAVKSLESAPATTDATTVPPDTDGGNTPPATTPAATPTANDTQAPSPQQIGPPMDCDLDGEDDDIRMDYDGDGLPDECEIY